MQLLYIYCLGNLARILLMDRQRRFTFQEALKQLQIVSDDLNNDSDAEATSSSETESIVDGVPVSYIIKSIPSFLGLVSCFLFLQ